MERLLPGQRNPLRPILSSLLSPFRGLGVLLGVGSYRRILLGSALAYLILLLVTLGDISPGGRGFGFQTTDWTRMFERIGPVTFEPVARITVPGLTLLVAPLNLLIATPLAALVGLGTTVTWVAWKETPGREMSPVLPAFATLLTGAACLAPGATIVFRIPVPSAFVPIFQLLIPLSLLLLLGILVRDLGRLA